MTRQSQQTDAIEDGLFTPERLYRDRPTELAFRSRQFETIGHRARVTGLVGGVLFFSALIYDHFDFGNTGLFWLLLVLRLGALIAGILLALTAQHADRSHPWRLERMLLAFEIYIGAAFLAVVGIHGGDGAFHTMSAMAIVLAFYIFLPNLSRAQLWFPPLFSLGFMACLMFVLQASGSILLISGLLLLLLNVLGFQFARIQNRSERLEYNNMEMLRLLNQELQEEVEERRAAEQGLRRLFEAAPVPMVLSRGHDGMVIRANQLALDLFGVRADQIPYIRAPDFYPDPAQRQALFEEVNRNDQVRGKQLTFQTAQGVHFDGLLSANRIEYEGHGDCVFVGVMDITEQNRIKQQLEKLANIDPLTELNNRRAFFLAAERELRRSKRNQAPLTVILIDVDNFKLVNDRYGHAIGDQALKCIAQALQRHIREFDVLGRLGGEEFALLLPGLDTDAANEVAERLRHEVEQPCPDIDIRPALALTISLGIAAVPFEANAIDSALSEADSAMYDAKHKGRNRSETYRP